MASSASPSLSASDTGTCHGVNSGFFSIVSYSARMASRSCGFVSPARNRACSGVSLWTWTRMSSRSAFWRRIRSTRTLPATSRISRSPGPASTGCCWRVSPANTTFAPWRSESWRM